MVDVNGVHAEIAQAPVELVFEEARAHAMATLHDFIGLENSRLNVLAIEIFVGVRGHGTIGGEIAAFGAQDEFVAREAFLRKLLEGGADAALAALETIVDGRVDNVEAILDGGDYGGGVGAVGFVVGLAEVGADAQGRKRQPVGFTKVSGGCEAPESIGVPFGAFSGGVRIHSCETR